MKLVADANVWYDIASGRIDPEQFKRHDGGIVRYSHFLLGDCVRINERLLHDRKGAASAVLNYATGVLEDTETHLAELWGTKYSP